MKNKSLWIAGIFLVLSMATALWAATALEINTFGVHEGLTIGKTVSFLAAGDTTGIVYLDEFSGPPALCMFQWRDNDTAGKGAAAASGGEIIYFDPAEFCDYAGDEYAGSVAGALSVYRIDADGADTLQTSVYADIVFFYKEYVF